MNDRSDGQTSKRWDKSGGRKKAPKVSPQSMERAALYYLERYGGSVGRVRRFLERRIRRAEMHEPVDREACAQAIEAVVSRLVELGYLNDEAFVRSRVKKLRRQGKSALAIRASLRRDGVDNALVDGVLSDAADAGSDEMAAARDFVRRRRLGSDRENATTMERDLRKLARAGFSYRVARAALAEVGESED